MQYFYTDIGDHQNVLCYCKLGTDKQECWKLALPRSINIEKLYLNGNITIKLRPNATTLLNTHRVTPYHDPEIRMKSTLFILYDAGWM